jgi:hypothetical protein
MGPVIIFDKSTLESLNPDEAMWLDNFYLSNITPLFFIETLADLEKKARSGRTAEDIVGSLAYKTPDYSSKPNAHHRNLLDGEIFYGQEVDMTYGRPHITGGKTVELGGKMGVFFEPSPEEEALSRWQKHEFIEIERNIAKKWRQDLSNIDLEETYLAYQVFFPLGKPKTLADVKKFVDFYIDGPDQELLITFATALIGLNSLGQTKVLERWRAAAKPSMREFVPYLTHVFSVELFFNLAIASDLIGRGRPSHKIDLAYLYYLPFCVVFTSNDKLHAEIVPFFLRENQSFVLGSELKTDLAKLDKHYDESVSEEEKARGVMSFAFYPPNEGDFLISRLWDKHMAPDWRKRSVKPKPQPLTPVSSMIGEEIRRMEKGQGIPQNTNVPLEKADVMSIKRVVMIKKGKWNRFPPEVLNRSKNEQGEWEDNPPVEKE